MPIPLTEEILLKCGFEIDDVLAPCMHVAKEWDLEWFIDGVYLDGSNTKAVYLHQLQNLYFALKGEELNITL